MNRFWRKNFYQPDPLNPEGPHLKDYNLMIARPPNAESAAAMAIRCAICPCGEQWSIVTICPCDQCGVADVTFLGAPVEASGGGGVTALYGDATVILYAQSIEYVAAPDGSEGGYLGGNVEPLDAPLGAVLWAIEHQTCEAPFDADVSADIIIDGNVEASWSGGAATKGEQIYVGDGDIAEVSEAVDLLPVDYSFETCGLHTLDIRVTFAEQGGDGSFTYSVRKILRINPCEEELGWTGDVAIVPSSVVYDDCSGPTLKIADAESGRIISFGMKVLKGPFDSREDAELVLDTWGDLIAAYASTCVCETGCGSFAIVADCIVEFNGKYVLDRNAAGDNAYFYCEDGYMEYDVSGASDLFSTSFPEMSISPVIYTAGGRWMGASTSGILSPCDGLYFEVSGSGGAGALPDPYEWGCGSCSASGIPEPTTCCIEDTESEFYGLDWDYDTETHSGVPGNSAELADYLESMEV